MPGMPNCGDIAVGSIQALGRRRVRQRRLDHRSPQWRTRQSWPLEILGVLSLAAFPESLLEPKAHLSHVLLYEAEPPAQSLKKGADARSPASADRTGAQHGLVAGFHARYTHNGRPFRTLSVIDEGNREGLRIECGSSI